MVATVRALKVHSGRHRIVAGRPLPPEMLAENPDEVHIDGAQPAQAARERAAARRHPGGGDQRDAGRLRLRARGDPRDRRVELGVRSAVCTNFTDGGRGAAELAEAVAEAADEPGDFRFLYPSDAAAREKIEAVARQIYGADGVDYTPAADGQLATYEKAGFGGFPVCIAKTHLSLSADPTLKGAPTGWRLPVREVRASVGAGFVYPICGDMRTMPGLTTHPAAEHMDIDADGKVVGLS